MDANYESVFNEYNEKLLAREAELKKELENLDEYRKRKDIVEKDFKEFVNKVIQERDNQIALVDEIARLKESLIDSVKVDIKMDVETIKEKIIKAAKSEISERAMIISLELGKNLLTPKTEEKTEIVEEVNKKEVSIPEEPVEEKLDMIEEIEQPQPDISNEQIEIEPFDPKTMLYDYLKSQNVELSPKESLALDKMNALGVPIGKIMEQLNITNPKLLCTIAKNPKYYYDLGLTAYRHYHNDTYYGYNGKSNYQGVKSTLGASHSNFAG